ncbi:hypothetical protein H0I29_02755 [Polaribacter sp. R2A056_3_33]|uniref:hypothetical protein n=1 Tax=unclassified Polaribacter TaxID=196858 RepID=UPI00087B46ED|nr:MULTISPECIES: hypothetical protein [unclassified Polaribacter]QXP71032.1 hypothetical protein H0I29_02755 [Polaribacter sp. R2A056_3_33]SDS11384.1 hypothetical protein SAMN05216503_2017 [Polaribacter sp. KT25b]
MEQIRNYNLEEFKKLLLNHFKEIYDLELLILKGHIITEFTINCYLENLSNSLDANFFKERYNHSLKIGMIEHFGKFGGRTLEIVKSLRLLNKIRNGIAHTLTVNEQLIQEYVNSVSQIASEDFINPDYEIRLKFSMATGYLCGEIFGEYYEQREKKEE